MGSITNILILAFATYGIAILLTDYDGPFKLFYEMRKQMGVFKCSVCLGFWIALFIGMIAGMSFTHIMASLGITILIVRNEQW